MVVMAQPHFLLFCDTHVGSDEPGTGRGQSRFGRWHFVLERLDGVERFEAGDAELRATRDRLDLLAVVRGLEALEQPSKVTLVTTSRYVARGLRYGLSSWRESAYQWERFGVQMPIRNADLWQRIDLAMSFHGLHCRLIQAGAVLEKDSDGDLGTETSEKMAGEPRSISGESRYPEGRHELHNRGEGWQIANQPRRPELQVASSFRQSAPACRENSWRLALSWFKKWKSLIQFGHAAYGT